MTESLALKGIRVLDLSRGPAAGLATMMLADFGADVVLVEDPREHAFANLPAKPMWQRGKRRLKLDLGNPANLKSVRQLLDGADVAVFDWRSSALLRHQLDYDSLHATHPHLIYSHVSGFGARGPKADYPGYEHIVAAASGRMLAFEGVADREGPVFSALQVGVHACAQSTCAGILAALYQRGSSARGRLVETSLLQGMLPYEQGAMIGRQYGERFARLYPEPDSSEPPMPSLYYHPTQAADGTWVQFGNLLPHLFDNFLLITDLVDVVGDEDFDPKQLLLKDPAKHEAFRERMLRRIQERTADAWLDAAIENGGVVAGRYQTTQAALADPDIVANGHVVARQDGVQIGPVARLTRTPAVPGDRATDISTDQVAWTPGSGATLTPTPAAHQASTDAPLTGVRVLELATIIAAPMGASFLADMGASVIKVEQIGGDPYRGLAMGVGSARVNAGKRSISLDLKSAQGQDIVQRLAAQCDILIHNYRPGVPERLGIDYETLAAINPGIVYLQCNGYGPDGPGALRPSTHPIPGAAMGGVVYQMGERLPRTLQDMDGLRWWTRRLMRANEVNPDPNTALVVANTAMLGLMARENTGLGQQIFVDMFGANAYANHDDFLSYPGKADRALPDALLLGLNPTYRLYPAAAGWVFVALTTARERAEFVRLGGEAGFEMPDEACLAGNDQTTIDALTALFEQADADQWEQIFAPRGVGCVRADRTQAADFWLTDPQVEALGLTQAQTHPAWGPYRRHGSNVTFDRKQEHLKPPPLAGQHAEDILIEAGYAADEIRSMFAAGVLYRETD